MAQREWTAMGAGLGLRLDIKSEGGYDACYGASETLRCVL